MSRQARGAGQVTRRNNKRNDELDNKLAALAHTLTRTDRILSGKGDVVVRFKDPGMAAPSSTDGTEIRIDPAQVSLRSASGLVNIQGLNYHELCHVLYSPRMQDQTLRKIREDGMHKAYNVLEDMRIETLFAATYGAAAKFFTAPIVTYYLGKQETWPTAHLAVYGRKFLPREIREEFAAQFCGTPAQRKRAEQIINAYRKVSFAHPRTFDPAIYGLVKDFAVLLQELKCDPSSDIRNPGNHPECASSDNTKGQPDKDAEALASRRRDEQDEAAEQEDQTESENDETETETDSDAEDANDGGEAADGADEPSDPGDGDGGDGEDGSDEGDPGEDGSAGGQDGADSGDREGDHGDADGSSGGEAGAPSGGEEGGDHGDRGELTEDPQPPGSASANERTYASLAEALSEALEEVMGDAEVQREVTTLTSGMNDMSHVDTGAKEAKFTRWDVTPEMAAASASIEIEIRRLNEQFESGWHYGTDHGRINIGRAMMSDGDYDSIYDTWEEGHEQDAGLTVVFALDMSGSMGNTMSAGESLIRSACQSLWVLSRGLENADVETVGLGFMNPALKLFGREDEMEPGQYRMYGEWCTYTDSYDAVLEASRMFGLSERPNRLFVMITDGGMTDNKSDTRDALRRMDAAKLLVNIGDYYHDEDLRACFDVASLVNDPRQLVELVRETVTVILNQAHSR